MNCQVERPDSTEMASLALALPDAGIIKSRAAWHAAQGKDQKTGLGILDRIGINLDSLSPGRIFYFTVTA